ncbi:unnamed protein product, partial [Symbiodinium microadriaticum]
ATFTSRLPNVAFCSGLPFAAAMSAEPSVPRNAHDISSIMEGAMESAEYSGAVSAMSEIMANAEGDAREFVNEKAEELGEEGAYQAALAYGFEAFDSDGDGKLLGQELRVLLEVSGRRVPEDVAAEIDAKGFECDLEEFIRIYERTERNCEDSEDGTCPEP